MAKWICVHDDHDELLAVVMNALKQNGYEAKAVPPDEASDVQADIALLCKKTADTNKLMLGDLTMDLSSITAYTRDGANIHFTPIEFSMLAFLIKNAHRAVPRSELLSVVWGFESSDSTRVADDTAKRLRRKLTATTVALETVWNYGFRVREK